MAILRVLLLITFIAALLSASELEEHNKALGRRFYEQVWFSHHPEVVDELVAPEYVVHDIGGRDGKEPASDQKDIPEFFWKHAAMTGKIDYQVAEGDLVVTRWQWDFQPSTWWIKLLGGRNPIAIINVMRFRDGKIVEFWNHRHDIDSAVANIPKVFSGAGGFVAGVLTAVVLGKFRRRKTA
jgi:predicted SnoaL-like aldol condensation-catalyzing enzyme